MIYSKQLIAALALAFFAFGTTGCRPEACGMAQPLIEKVRTAIDDEKLDAAAAGLEELVTVLADEGGYLGGFRDKSASLREQIEKQHDTSEMSARDRDIAERRLVPLIEGWQREARAVSRRCATTYLL